MGDTESSSGLYWFQFSIRGIIKCCCHIAAHVFHFHHLQAHQTHHHVHSLHYPGHDTVHPDNSSISCAHLTLLRVITPPQRVFPERWGTLEDASEKGVRSCCGGWRKTNRMWLRVDKICSSSSTWWWEVKRFEVTDLQFCFVLQGFWTSIVQTGFLLFAESFSQDFMFLGDVCIIFSLWYVKMKHKHPTEWWWCITDVLPCVHWPDSLPLLFCNGSAVSSSLTEAAGRIQSLRSCMAFLWDVSPWIHFASMFLDDIVYINILSMRTMLLWSCCHHGCAVFRTRHTPWSLIRSSPAVSASWCGHIQQHPWDCSKYCLLHMNQSCPGVSCFIVIFIGWSLISIRSQLHLRPERKNSRINITAVIITNIKFKGDFSWNRNTKLKRILL